MGMFTRENRRNSGIQPTDPATPPPTPPGLLRNLAVDVALPWITVQLLQRAWGVPIVPAFAAAAIFPAASILLSWRRHRRPDFIGIGVLATILTGIAIALLTNDVRFAVLKAAPGFGLFGIACLLSLGRERPLMFFVSRQFSAGGDEVGDHSIEYRIETGGYTQHGLITGTNAFAQHLRRNGMDMFMLFSGAPIDPLRTRSFFVIGVRKGKDSAAKLGALRDFVERLLDEDKPVLNTMRFRQGMLVASDQHLLSRYFKYVGEFPRAEPPSA